MKNYIEEDSHDGILPSDLFRLNKSYDQIMADHRLIRQIKITLEQSVLHGYITCYPFEELIKEAYFQCGIIQLRPCCRSYYDYWRVFINRDRYISGLNDKTRTMIVGGMVYLLLFTRKNTNIGTATIIDEIWKNVKHDLDICFSPVNPFEKLLDITEPHEIDFGISPLPIDAEEWKNVYWGRIEKIVGEEDEWYIDGLDDYNKMLNGTFDEKAYCQKYINSLQIILDTIDFKTKQELLKLLDIIMVKDLFYVCEEKIPQCMTPCLGCEYPYECVEHETYNRLKKYSIEEMKQQVIEKFSVTKIVENSVADSRKTDKIRDSKKVYDFHKKITKPENSKCILNRLHELMDRQDKPEDKIKPFCAAICAGAINSKISWLDFTKEFGEYNKSTYYTNRKKFENEEWRIKDRDFCVLINEFIKMM